MGPTHPDGAVCSTQDTRKREGRIYPPREPPTIKPREGRQTRETLRTTEDTSKEDFRTYTGSREGPQTQETLQTTEDTSKEDSRTHMGPTHKIPLGGPLNFSEKAAYTYHRGSAPIVNKPTPSHQRLGSHPGPGNLVTSNRTPTSHYAASRDEVTHSREKNRPQGRQPFHKPFPPPDKKI